MRINKNRITAALTALFVSASMLSITAFAEGENIVIDAVDVIGEVIPYVGVTEAQQTTQIKVPEGANYSIDYVNWYTYVEDDDEYYDFEDDTFEEGVIYAADFYVIPNEGYEFADDAVLTINGEDTLVEDFYCRVDADSACVSLVNTEAKEMTLTTITEIDVEGFDLPAAGQTLGDILDGLKLPEGANYELMDTGSEANPTCFELDEDYLPVGDSLSPDTVFEVGKIYGFQVMVTPKFGYVFDANAEITVNGSTEYVYEDSYVYSSGEAFVGFVYEVPEYVLITEIGVEGYVEPTIGETVEENLASVKLPEGANYSMGSLDWGVYDEELEDFRVMEGNEVFEEGKQYSFRAIVYPNVGYAFSATGTFTVNGDGELVSEYSWADEFESYILTECEAKPAEEEPEEEPEDEPTDEPEEPADEPEEPADEPLDVPEIDGSVEKDDPADDNAQTGATASLALAGIALAAAAMVATKKRR